MSNAEYKRVLNAWAADKLDLPISDIVSVDFDYQEGGPLSELTYDDAIFCIFVSYRTREGKVEKKMVNGSTGDYFGFGELLTALLKIAAEDES